MAADDRGAAAPAEQQGEQVIMWIVAPELQVPLRATQAMLSETVQQSAASETGQQSAAPKSRAKAPPLGLERETAAGIEAAAQLSPK